MYLLDTDICIYLLNGKAPRAEARLRELDRDEVGVTAITVAELSFGAVHSGRPERNLARVEAFLAPLVRVPFDDAAAACFARIKQALTASGGMIGAMDLLIAATALAFPAVLVTNNTRDFARVPGLEMENWMR